MKQGRKLYLIRHGQVLGYDDFPIYGHTDVELTEVGILQMEHLAERLRLVEIGVIYSSDLKRCLAGARILARHHDVSIQPMAALREVYFGAWEGMGLSEIREQFPRELTEREADLVHFAPPGNGESIARLAERVLPCTRDILNRHKEGNIVIVGHGAVNRVILCDALGLDLSRMFNLHLDYGCLSIIEYHPDRTLVRLVNG
ncbi:MAG: histidine phosphatase family protein [Deltaproteobacteria bacterium]|nr:histidine phosphatase family protein [Deltaproteobacteria bacterium]